MLTRIEIDGFKSFEDFSLDLSPYAVILGGNASGKSNLFDAIQLLSHLASSDLRTATRGLRGDVATLFRQVAPGRSCTRMRFAVEVLLEPGARDPWGKEVALAHTRVRYEVEVERSVDERGLERLTVASEAAHPILAKDDRKRWRPYGESVSQAFKDTYLRYSGRSVPWLETVHDGGRPSFRIHQDGTPGRVRPGHAAEATVLSSITTSDFPHLYALREELRSWRLLQLDPFGLRRPAPLHSDEALSADGANLAAVLYRLKTETQTPDEPGGIISDIVAELSAIIPGVLGLDVEMSTAAREYRASLVLRGGLELPASVISDGTLRVLALLTVLKDPRHRGVVCFEEPENGVHPARLGDLMRRLHDLVTDPSGDDQPQGRPLTQLLMNSHSPVVLSVLREERVGQVLFADVTTVADPGTHQTRGRTRIRPIGSVEQDEMFDIGSRVTRMEVERYLQTVNTGA